MSGRGASSGKVATRNRRFGEAMIQQRYNAAEEKALYDYTKSSHINSEIADSEKHGTALDEKWAKMKKALDKAISRSIFHNYKGELYRGGGGIMIGVPMTMSFPDRQSLADYINNNLIGKTSVNVAYSSTTTSASTARAFAAGEHNPVIMDIKEMGKVHGAAVSGQGGGSPISFFGHGEDEVVLQRNVTYTPIGKAYIGTDGHVHVPVRADVKK